MSESGGSVESDIDFGDDDDNNDGQDHGNLDEHDDEVGEYEHNDEDDEEEVIDLRHGDKFDEVDYDNSRCTITLWHSAETFQGKVVVDNKIKTTSAARLCLEATKHELEIVDGDVQYIMPNHDYTESLLTFLRSLVPQQLRIQTNYKSGFRLFVKTSEEINIAKAGTATKNRFVCELLNELSDMKLQCGHSYIFVVVGTNVDEKNAGRLSNGGSKLGVTAMLESAIDSHANTYKTRLMTSTGIAWFKEIPELASRIVPIYVTPSPVQADRDQAIDNLMARVKLSSQIALQNTPGSDVNMTMVGQLVKRHVREYPADQLPAGWQLQPPQQQHPPQQQAALHALPLQNMFHAVNPVVAPIMPVVPPLVADNVYGLPLSPRSIQKRKLNDRFDQLTKRRKQLHESGVIDGPALALIDHNTMVCLQALEEVEVSPANTQN